MLMFLCIHVLGSKDLYTFLLLLTCFKSICILMCVHVQVEKHMKEQAAAEAAMSVAGAQTSPQ